MTIATKRKDSPKGLTEDKYFNLIEHAADGIAIIQDGVFKLVNTALGRIAGYDKEELLGMPFTELLSPKSQKLTLARYQARLAGKKVPPIYEIQAVTKNGEIRDIEVNAALTEYEGRVADEVIVRDITERKQVEEALRESEEEKNAIIEGAPVGICHTDLKGTIKYVNERFEEESGYSREEIIGKNAFKLDWFSKGTLRYFMQRGAARLRGKPHKYWETQFKRKDGTWIWVTTEGKVIKKLGVPIGFQILARNITERKQAEETLKLQKAYFQQLFDNSPEAIVLLDNKNRIVSTNKGFETLYGYTMEEVKGRAITEITVPEDRMEEASALGKAILNNEASHKETVRKRKDGSLVDVSLLSYPIRLGNKSVGGYVIYRDITGRKKAEEALQAEKNKLQSVIGAMEYDLTIQDKDYNIIYQNEPSRVSSGGDHVGEKCYRVYEAREDVCEGCPVEKAFKDGKSHTAERRRIMPSGEVAFFENTANPIRDAKGNIVSCLEIGRNITERKQAEEALRESQEFSSSLLQSSPNPILVINPDTSVKYLNPAFEKLTGFKLAEIAGRKAPYPWWPERKRKEITAALEDAMAHGGRRTERKFQKKNGERFWAAVNSAPVVHEGKPLYFILNWLDITERKQAEQALADEATRRHILVDQSLDGIVILDENSKVYEANQQFAEMLGYTPEELSELHTWDWDTQWSREELLEMGRKVDETGYHLETYHRRKDGTTIDVEISVNGAVIAGKKFIFCVCRDITERKQAEEKLRESEQYLKTLFNATTGGILVIDPETHRIVDANPAISQMVGVPRKQIIGRVCHKFICPNEAGKCPITDLKQEIDTKECQILNAQGKEISVLKSVVPIMRQGRQYLLELVFDITERKQAEDALKESEERYRTVIEGAHDMIQSVALDGRINFVNQAWLDTLGYTEAELPGLNLFEIIHPDSRPHCQELFAKVLKGDSAHDVQATFLTKDGRKILVEGNATPRYIGDKVVATQGIFRDITERKNMEQQLQEKNEQLDAQNEELRTINEELRATEEELQHSQERLERMFESVTDGIVVAALDGTIIKVNEKAVKMHGFSSEDEILGKNALELSAPRDHEKIASNMRKALKEGTVIGAEYTLVKADGSEFPGELSTSVLKDASGKVIGHITIARDITERKQTQELLRTVANSSPVGIYIVQDRKFQRTNPQFQKLTGYTKDELLGMDSLTFILPEDRDMVREKAIKMLKGKSSAPYQFRVVNKAGEIRWVMETVTSIQFRGRRAILGNYMDITERRQAEERERQLQQELNLAGRLASIGQLAAGVAHEINNPLTGVIGFSHLMMNRDIPDEMKQDLQVIHSEAQRVAKIVENLLIFAHQRKPGQEYVDINEIITRVLELRDYEMRVNNIEVESQFAPDLPSTMANAGQLQQVFLNIVLNAEHFMAKAHHKGKLQIKTEKVDGNIRASFIDDGSGISRENLDKIFNPFFTTKEVGDGTGLGLSICHSIISQHKGRIYAQSELGKGAAFVVELPIVAEPAQAGKARVKKKEPEKPKGAKILVVDDEAAILTFLKRLLTEWGHSVETINNANKALERLKTERYSLILLDIKLPGMSGIELYHHIEEIAPALTRRVMFITGDVMEAATRDFLEQAKVPHIIKPLDIDVLKKMINRALNGTQVAAAAGK